MNDIIRKIDELERRLREIESTRQTAFRIGAAGYRNTTYPVSTSTWTKIPLNTVWFDIYPPDSDAHFDAANGHFIVRKAGYYLLTAEISFSANATGGRYAAILLNGSTNNIQVIGSAPGITSADTRVAAATIAYLNASDNVELWAFQNSGTTLNVQYYTAPRRDGNQLCFWLLA